MKERNAGLYFLVWQAGRSKRMPDVGCLRDPGNFWLARALAALGCHLVGARPIPLA
jgi:hypothetical protein